MDTRTKLQLPLYVWSAINPISQKREYGNAKPTIIEAHYSGFELCSEGKIYTSVIWIDTDMPGYENSFVVTWNNNDDTYYKFQFETMTEALEFQAMLNSVSCWNELMDLLDECCSTFKVIPW